MTLPEYCIKRPVFTVVLSLMLVIAGLLHYKKLGIRLLPNIDKPTIHIATDYPGANPDLVEKEITIPIENSLSSIAGIDHVRSMSLMGKSRINIDFQLNVNINDTLSDIRNKLSTLQNKLPKESQLPIISKNDTDSEPVIMLGFRDDKKSPLQITDYVNRFIKPVLQETKGVGEVVDHGARNYAIKIAIDPVKMAAYHVTVAQLKRALIQQNIDVPSGQIKSKNRFYTVVTHTRLQNAKHFSELVIDQRHNQLIHLRDVAKVSVGSENEDNLLRINGNPAVGLAILAQSTANPIEVAKDVKETLARLTPTLPPHFTIQVIFDPTHFIEESIHEVYKSFVEATLFVGLVIFLFLGSLRAAIIPIITIPICLISAFFPMVLLGFELNTMTLLAMVLAIGLVVDDAIVVLENCHRHMQQGLNARDAAIQGSKEILFAIIAMTITLAAVYAPTAFVSGFTGKLFLQFGLTLAVCVLISGIIAITLSPMMCSSLLKMNPGGYHDWLDKKFIRIERYYTHSLDHLLKHPMILITTLLMACGIGLFCYLHLGGELAPTEDQGYIIGSLSSPTNSSLSYTDHYTRQLEAIYKTIPEQDNYLVSVKPNAAFTVLRLRPWEQRKRTQEEISQDLSKKMQQITGVNAYPISPNPLAQHGDNSRFSFALLGNTSYQRLHRISNDIIKQLEKTPELKHIKSSLALDSERIEIDIDRQLASDLQINLADVAELLSTMLGGSYPANFTYEGQAYKVILQIQEAERHDIAVLNKLYVQSKRGKMIPLSSLIQIKNTIGPDSLPHLNRMRSVSITAELVSKTHFDTIIHQVEALLQEKLPEDIEYRFTGSTNDYLESAGSSLFAFCLALLFIYLVLAAQFESYRDPLIVLLSVPLSLIGAVVTLYLFKEPLSIYSNVAIISLIGLITKHGILITEFANKQRYLGLSKHSAIMNAARTRLRPILMTTSVMILGALPLAMASGAGCRSHQQLGLVILGGMFVGTLFSLYVVPFAYFITSRQTVKNREIILDKTDEQVTIG